MDIPKTLLAAAAIAALTAQTPGSGANSEASAFAAMIGQGLAAAAQDFSSIRNTTNTGNQYVGIYGATAPVDATYLANCSVTDETDSSSFEHPSWLYSCTIANAGDSSDARLAQIATGVAPSIPEGFTRTDRSFSGGGGGELVYWSGPGDTYVVIQKGPGAGFALSVRHGPGSVDY
jgi:hypothetical protein